MKRQLKVRLASPRGFCAGVERAVRAVEDALAAEGAPVYVRHEIVHNAHVVDRLKAMGAVFVERVEDAPAGRPVIFSAHGAPASAYAAANDRGQTVIDATCPLVKKVHAQARRYAARARHVILVGHRGHPEVEGTMGQAPAGAVTLVETLDDARTFRPPAGAALAYVTQTTLSLDDTAEIVDCLKARFPAIEGPRTSDICYATSNRQAAVKALAPGCDTVLVLGSPSSSNSCRLVEVALHAGAATAELVADPAKFDPASLGEATVIGVTAGASAPEALVEALLLRLAHGFTLSIETVETAREDVVFKSPLPLAS